MRAAAVVITLLAAANLAAASAERSVTIFEGRTIAVTVPDGWTFRQSRSDATGVETITFDDPSGEIHVDASFLPDLENHLASQEALEAEMKRAFKDLLAGAVEKEFKFVYAKTVDGMEGHMIFTDKTLVGKAASKDDRRLATTGIRRWDGVFMLFTVLSNQTESAAYKAALHLIAIDIRDTTMASKA